LDFRIPVTYVRKNKEFYPIGLSFLILINYLNYRGKVLYTLEVALPLMLIFNPI